jgi:hypothetical protein
MSSTGNKGWIYALAAAGALVSAAVVFHLVSNKSASGSSLIFEEIDALGPAKKEPNGLLNFMYYKDVFGIIQKYSKAKFGNEKKQMLETRRRLLAEGKQSEYKDLVKEMIQKEEGAFGDLLQEAMDHIGVSEQEFMMTHQTYM